MTSTDMKPMFDMLPSHPPPISSYSLPRFLLPAPLLHITTSPPPALPPPPLAVRRYISCILPSSTCPAMSCSPSCPYLLLLLLLFLLLLLMSASCLFLSSSVSGLGRYAEEISWTNFPNRRHGKASQWLDCKSTSAGPTTLPPGCESIRNLGLIEPQVANRFATCRHLERWPAMHNCVLRLHYPNGTGAITYGFLSLSLAPSSSSCPLPVLFVSSSFPLPCLSFVLLPSFPFLSFPFPSLSFPFPFLSFPFLSFPRKKG